MNRNSIMFFELVWLRFHCGLLNATKFLTFKKILESLCPQTPIISATVLHCIRAQKYFTSWQQAKYLHCFLQTFFSFPNKQPLSIPLPFSPFSFPFSFPSSPPFFPSFHFHFHFIKEGSPSTRVVLQGSLHLKLTY